MTTNIEALRTALPNLTGRDAEFASSLLESHERYGNLTDRQWPWVDKLVDRATKATKPREQVGDLAPLLTMFDHARKHLKYPAIVLHVEGMGNVRLYVAGEKARVPGSVNVVEPDGERKWFGRILRDGSFDASNRDQAPDALVPALRKFACDPIGQAAEHGKLTGACCFCNRALGKGKDKRSVAVGYGPDCAEHYGLAWGKTETTNQPLARLVA